MVYHGVVLGDSQMLHRDDHLDLLVVLGYLTRSSPPKVGVTSPTGIVCFGVRVVLYVCDNLSIEWVCISVVRIATSHNKFSPPT